MTLPKKKKKKTQNQINCTTFATESQAVEGEMGRKECLHFLVCLLFAKRRKLKKVAIVVSLLWIW